MKDRRLFLQIFPSFLIVVVLVIILLASYEFEIIKEFYTHLVVSDLEIRADLICRRIETNKLLENPRELQSACIELSKIADVRVTVIRRDGQVLSDSHKDPNLMDNHGDRPEIIEAFSGKTGYSSRYSYTLKKQLLYLAVPLHSKEQVDAVVRLAMSFSDYQTTLFRLQRRLIWGGLIILLLTGLVSYGISRRVSKPLEEIQRGAKRFAMGDFSRPVAGRGSKEIVDLAETLSTMALQLDKRIRTISLQRNEQEAMFRSMKEGILAIDLQEKILLINQAAIKFFNIPKQDVQKRPVYEVIRNKDVLNFINRALHSAEHMEEEVTVLSDKERVLLLNGNLLQNTDGETIGTLIVMNDITRIKQLDKMRQEFVANVSHELKTPITSIKGYVETLLGGDVKDDETISRFLKIIARHSDRMNAIIEDLLQLSKIEQQGKTGIPLEEEELLPVIHAAIQECRQRAEKKRIHIKTDCPVHAKALINVPLLEQAIINLLDNAVKYSDEDSRVIISVKKQGEQLLISVQDWGCGIAPEYHDRLFERFYRVDKGRSRKMGGTGLGLSIVKHIALVHRGQVEVESTPGKGSIFTISLPLV